MKFFKGELKILSDRKLKPFKGERGKHLMEIHFKSFKLEIEKIKKIES